MTPQPGVKAAKAGALQRPARNGLHIAYFLLSGRLQARPLEGTPQARLEHHCCNNNKKGFSMFKQKKFKQATLILIAVTVILILPNLTRLVS